MCLLLVLTVLLMLLTQSKGWGTEVVSGICVCTWLFGGVEEFQTEGSAGAD